jgi:tetratricopeptide (TPR) repeat protein
MKKELTRFQEAVVRYYFGLNRGDHEALSEAEALFKDELEEREKTYGSSHIEVASCLQCLANLWCYQKKLENAEEALKRLIQIYEKHGDWTQAPPASSSSDIMTARCRKAQAMVCLAGVYQLQNKLPEAKSVCKEAWLIIDKTVGTSSERVESPLSKLAEICRALGEDDEAQRYEQLIKSSRKFRLALQRKDKKRRLALQLKKRRLDEHTI